MKEVVGDGHFQSFAAADVESVVVVVGSEEPLVFLSLASHHKSHHWITGKSGAIIPGLISAPFRFPDVLHFFAPAKASRYRVHSLQQARKAYRRQGPLLSLQILRTLPSPVARLMVGVFR